MSIRYLCPRCSELLNLTGIEAVNEVGRKNCEGCGDNEDNLISVDTKDCDDAIAEWNSEH